MNDIMIINNYTPDESQRIKVNHVFECEECHRYWLGSELPKVDGKRTCRNCSTAVQDITFTQIAQQYLYRIGLPFVVKPW